MYTIYKITNRINGKAYVGFDSNWPSRKSVHICEAITRKNKKYPLYRAIRKYGLENFEWKILYQGEDRNYTLNVVENKMIIEHNTHFKNGHGYNMTYGGEGALGWIPTDETKRKIGLGTWSVKPNIKDFDNDIIETEFSKFEYEKDSELTNTDESKLYVNNLITNSLKF